MKLHALALSACLLTQAALAADEADLLLGELPLIASVSRLPQRPQNLPASVTVLDRAVIRASGARQLSDLMRLVPGFQTFAHTTDPVRVTYHGTTDDDFSPRVQVLIDGRSLYSPLFRSGVNWNLMPVALEDIERIEVVRGTNSAAYGTNAFLGVINIITVDPSLVRETNLAVNYGNQGVRDYSLRTGGRLGDAGHLRLTYQQKDDRALKDRADWSDRYQSRLLDIRGDLQLNTRDTLQLRLGRAEASMSMGLVSGPDQGGFPLHPFDQSATYFQANLNRVLDDDAELALRYAYTRDRAFDDFQAFSPNFGVYYADSAFTGSAQRQELEILHTTAPLHNLRLSWGAGYRRDMVESASMFHDDPRQSRRVTRQFGNLEWRPSSWLTANFGASFDQDSLAGNSLSPRAALNVHLSPEHTLRLAIAKAVRSGAIADYRGSKWYEATRDASGAPVPPGSLYKFAYIGDPRMPSERLNAIELGYIGDWRQLGMNVDLRVFQEVIPNRLLLSERQVTPLGLCDAICPNSTADFVTEAQHLRIQGLEYQWQWQPDRRTRLLVSQAYTEIKARYLDRYLNNPYITDAYLGSSALERDRRLAEDSAPRLASSFMLIQKLSDHWTLSLAAYQQRAMKWTRNTTADGYTRIDARLAYAFRLGANAAEVGLTSQSLNGRHGEFKASGQADDRIVNRRTWLSFTLGL